MITYADLLRYMYISIGLLIAGIIAEVVVGLSRYTGGKIGKRVKEGGEKLILMIIVSGLYMTVIFGILALTEYRQEERMENLSRAQEEGWGFYIDGQEEEVSPDNIDVNNYHITFDEAQHKVLLARKR